MRAWAWHFYPRSPCGERHPETVPCSPHAHISIHALLAESDGCCGWRHCVLFRFLSTLSLRRATPRCEFAGQNELISIHALLAESDCSRPSQPSRPPAFLSTLSLRRATYIWPAYLQRQIISIHALLAESDDVACGYWHKLRHFYPRSPCGERPSILHKNICVWGFLSTLSLRRATTLSDCQL